MSQVDLLLSHIRRTLEGWGPRALGTELTQYRALSRIDARSLSIV